MLHTITIHFLGLLMFTGSSGPGFDIIAPHVQAHTISGNQIPDHTTFIAFSPTQTIPDNQFVNTLPTTPIPGKSLPYIALDGDSIYFSSTMDGVSQSSDFRPHISDYCMTPGEIYTRYQAPNDPSHSAVHIFLNNGTTAPDPSPSGRIDTVAVLTTNGDFTIVGLRDSKASFSLTFPGNAQIWIGNLPTDYVTTGQTMDTPKHFLVYYEMVTGGYLCHSVPSDHNQGRAADQGAAKRTDRGVGVDCSNSTYP